MSEVPLNKIVKGLLLKVVATILITLLAVYSVNSFVKDNTICLLEENNFTIKVKYRELFRHIPMKGKLYNTGSIIDWTKYEKDLFPKIDCKFELGEQINIDFTNYEKQERGITEWVY